MKNEPAGTLSASGFPSEWALYLKNRSDLLIIIFLFVLTLAFHISTAARTVTFSDAGDFLMGISTVGNVHSPGYPLYLMTAKLFCWFIPIGSLAFRASLYSGLFAALTTCLVYWIVFRMAHSRLAGVVAGLAYAFSYTFWYQSVIPETYSLNAFFIALMIVLALRWERLLKQGRDESADNTLCVFALVFGLALSNHFSIIFLLPAFIFFALDTNWRHALAPRNLLRMAAFLALGLLPYVYEPAAAFRGPAYNYGDPSTPLRWYHHFTVYYLRGGLFNYPYRFVPGRLFRYFATLATEFPYFWWLGGLGFLTSFRKRSKKYPLFLFLLFLLTLLPAITYLQSEPVLRAHFYYESYLIFAIWMGMGTACLVNLCRLAASRADRLLEYGALALVGLLVALCPLCALAAHYDKVDKSGYFYARDMAAVMLETTERDSVIVVDEDNVIFPCMYMQVVEKLRPDVRVVSVTGAGVPGFQGGDLLAYTPPGYSAKAQESNLAQLITRNYRRLPIYSTVTSFVNFEWNQYWLGFLARVYPKGTTPPKPPSEGGKRLPGTGGSGFKDSDARWAVSLPRALNAVVLFAKLDYKAAERIYRLIIPKFQRDIYVPTLYGCGSFSELYELWGQALNLQGDFKGTARHLPGALAIDPDFRSLALARAYAADGDYANAIKEFDKYLAFQPDDAAAKADLGETYTMLKEYPRAASLLRESIKGNPGDSRAHLLYGRVLFLQGDEAGARSEFEAVMRMDPSGPLGGYAREYLRQLD